MSKPKLENPGKAKGIPEPLNPVSFVILHFLPFISLVAPFMLSHNWKRLGRPHYAKRILLLKAALTVTMFMGVLLMVYLLSDDLQHINASTPQYVASIGFVFVLYIAMVLLYFIIPMVEIILQLRVYKEMTKVKNDALR